MLASVINVLVKAVTFLIPELFLNISTVITVIGHNLKMVAQKLRFKY